MRKHLYMGDMNPEKFADRLKKLNKYLLYFPTKEGQNSTQLAEDELIDILFFGLTIQYRQVDVVLTV